MSIDFDEFDIWRSNPITKAYFDKIEREKEIAKQHWIDLAWNRGVLSEKEYAYHRARVDALSQMLDLDYEDIFEEAEADGSYTMEKDRSNG